jgi:hypothetical protein
MFLRTFGTGNIISGVVVFERYVRVSAILCVLGVLCG